MTKKLFSSLEFTCESYEEATFAFIFSVIDGKKMLKPSAISLLSVTMFPSMINDALIPEAKSRKSVSWSSEEISVSRGNFLGKCRACAKRASCDAQGVS